MKTHNFSHTVITHLEDGTSELHYIHEKHSFDAVPVREGDVVNTVPDYDSMMDDLMDHTAEPNPFYQEWGHLARLCECGREHQQ